MSGNNQVHPIFQPLIDAIAPKAAPHTPGPWCVAPLDGVYHGDGSTKYNAVKRYWPMAGAYERIADCSGSANPAANAKLIAAAPELAKALADLLDAFRECVGHAAFDEFDASNPAVIGARAVIAKAGL